MRHLALTLALWLAPSTALAKEIAVVVEEAITAPDGETMVVGEALILEDEDTTAPLLTLEEALDLALGNNRDVQNAGLEVAKAADGVAAVRAMRLPQLQVGVYESYNFTSQSFTFAPGSLGEYPVDIPGLPEQTIQIPNQETQIDSAKDFTTLVTARVALPVSQQYRLGLGVEQKEVQEDRAGQQLRSTRQSTAQNAKDLYFSILRSEAALRATRASVVYLQGLSGVVARNVQQRRALEADDLSVQTKLARARQRAQSERDDIASQREELNILLGRDLETPFRVSQLPGPAKLTVNSLEAESQALAQRPAVKDAILKRQGAELGVKIKKSEYIPDVSVEVRYTSPFGAEFIPKNLASVGLFASWDVWDWGKRSHEVAAKNLELKQAKNNLREVQARVRADVNRKVRALRLAEARIPVAQLAEKTAREKLRVAENRYREQAVLIEDVLEAEADLASSRRDSEDAKLGVWKGWSDLQRAMGEE